MQSNHYDIIFISTGACFSGFLSLVKNNPSLKGKKILVVEDFSIGGNCLNYTCLPVQYLYEGAKLMRGIKQSYYYGVVFDVVRFDYSMLRSQLLYYIEEIKEKMLKKAQSLGMEIIYGKPKVHENHIEVNGKKIYADKIIVAHNTSYCFEHDVLKVDNHTCFLAQRFLDYKGEIKRVAVYGNKSFSYTLATILANLSNVEVFYLVEGKFLEDVPIDERLKDSLKERLIEESKINFIENSKVKRYWHKNNRAFIELEGYCLIDYLDVIFVEGKRCSNIKDIISYDISTTKEGLVEVVKHNNIYFCGDILKDISGTEKEFWVMDEIVKDIVEGKGDFEIHKKKVNFVRGFPGIAYNKYRVEENNKEIIVKAEEYPLHKVFGLNPKDIIKIYVDDQNIIKGYEIISHNAEIFANYLNIFINHQISFNKEVIFNPHYLMLLRRLETFK